MEENTNLVEEVDNSQSKPNVEEKTYSQAEIDALQAKIDDLLQYKPKKLTEEELKLKEKAESLWQKQVSLELKEQGLDDFKDFIRIEVDDLDALNNQITKLKEIVGTLELSNSYKPTNHKNVDGYSIAKKNKDTKSMISEKLKF